MKKAELEAIRDGAMERAKKVDLQSVEGKALCSLIEAVGDTERVRIGYDRALSSAARAVAEAQERFEAAGEASPWLDGSLRNLQECGKDLKTAYDALKKMTWIVG